MLHEQEITLEVKKSDIVIVENSLVDINGHYIEEEKRQDEERAMRGIERAA
jgi:hypothetical protein